MSNKIKCATQRKTEIAMNAKKIDLKFIYKRKLVTETSKLNSPVNGESSIKNHPT